MDKRDKQVQPQDPKAEAQTAEQKREADRQTKGFRFKGRKLFRRAGAFYRSDAQIKERIVGVEWR